MDNWKKGTWPIQPVTTPLTPLPTTIISPPNLFEVYPESPEYVTKEEFEKLKKDFEAFKKLLLAAKEYDEVTGQPDCEMEDKVAMVRKVAEMLGVDVDDVFGKSLR